MTMSAKLAIDTSLIFFLFIRLLKDICPNAEAINIIAGRALLTDRSLKQPAPTSNTTPTKSSEPSSRILARRSRNPEKRRMSPRMKHSPLSDVMKVAKKIYGAILPATSPVTANPI
jgi:hypothetical protein